MRKLSVILLLLFLQVEAYAEPKPKSLPDFPRMENSGIELRKLTWRDYFEFADFELKSNRLDSAGLAYKKILEAGDFNRPWLCYYRLAYISAQQGNLEKTREYLSKAMEAESGPSSGGARPFRERAHTP